MDTFQRMICFWCVPIDRLRTWCLLHRSRSNWRHGLLDWPCNSNQGEIYSKVLPKFRGTFPDLRKLDRNLSAKFSRQNFWRLESFFPKFWFEMKNEKIELICIGIGKNRFGEKKIGSVKKSGLYDTEFYGWLEAWQDLVDTRLSPAEREFCLGPKFH